MKSIKRSYTVNKQDKMFYTIAEAIEYLHITENVLSRKLILFNMETRKLPGSKKDYIEARNVMLIERHIKDPTFLP